MPKLQDESSIAKEGYVTEKNIRVGTSAPSGTHSDFGRKITCRGANLSISENPGRIARRPGRVEGLFTPFAQREKMS